MTEIEELDVRIEQLACDAREYVTNYDGDDVVPRTALFYRKFTELIVQECIAVIEEQAEHIHAEGTIEAITNLEKHFGVD